MDIFQIAKMSKTYKCNGVMGETQITASRAKGQAGAQLNRVTAVIVPVGL